MKINNTPTQKQMAEYLGIAQGMVSSLVSGKKPMSLKMARKMEEKFPQTSYTWWLEIKPAVIGKFWSANIPTSLTNTIKTKIHKHSQKNESKREKHDNSTCNN